MDEGILDADWGASPLGGDLELERRSMATHVAQVPYGFVGVRICASIDGGLHCVALKRYCVLPVLRALASGISCVRHSLTYLAKGPVLDCELRVCCNRYPLSTASKLLFWGRVVSN